jgi:hypothetical protein
MTHSPYLWLMAGSILSKPLPRQVSGVRILKSPDLPQSLFLRLMETFQR